MISSMTSFSRQSHDSEWGSLVWEIRTVNHRFLELSLRCPDLFRDQEMAIRERIQKRLSRGKVEASLKFVPGPELPVDFAVNESLLKRLADAEKSVRQYFPEATTSTTDLLSWKGVLQTVEQKSEALQNAMLDLLEKTLSELVEVRQREGLGLSHFIQANGQKIAVEVGKVKQQLPMIMAAERERITQRLQEVQENGDAQRLEQEMAIWAQRADVAEELQRLESHLDEVTRVLDHGGVVGRRLDFLMQELNREANTLSSKSMHAGMTQSAVEMKVLIEQIREQVQNIE
ncbi:MAG: YicC family protein [Coxiellaceae bacterium]|nr:YicC family protein [Coxiellaceae bacterium]